MTGRERLRRIVDRRPVDRLSRTTLIDAKTKSAMPEPYRSMTSLEIYKAIGCDIMQFGNYGLPEDCRVRTPCRISVERMEAAGYTGGSCGRPAVANGDRAAGFLVK